MFSAAECKRAQRPLSRRRNIRAGSQASDKHLGCPYFTSKLNAYVTFFSPHAWQRRGVPGGTRLRKGGALTDAHGQAHSVTRCGLATMHSGDWRSAAGH